MSWKSLSCSLVLMGSLLSLLPGCAEDPEDSRIQVVCTTPQVADLVRSIGGEEVAITTLMEGEGIDPHTYEPNQDDISVLARADLIFYSGHHLEGKFDTVFKQLADEKTIVALGEAIPQDKLLKGENGAVDPHLWFDAALWSEAVEPVQKTLSEKDPDHSADYAARAEEYRDNLLKLAAQAKQEIGTIPEQRRVLVTAHDAFSYFANAYGLQVKSIQGISTESEPTLQEINALVDFMVKNKIPSIFVEQSVNERDVKAIIEGCARQNHTVKIGGNLFSDSMGNPDTSTGTYEGMFRYNLKTIVEALK